MEILKKLLPNTNFVEKVFEEISKNNYSNVRDMFKEKNIEITDQQIENLKIFYEGIRNQVNSMSDNEIDKIKKIASKIGYETEDRDEKNYGNLDKIKKLNDKQIDIISGGAFGDRLELMIFGNALNSAVSSVMSGLTDIFEGNFKKGTLKTIGSLAVVTGLVLCAKKVASTSRLDEIF